VLILAIFKRKLFLLILFKIKTIKLIFQSNSRNLKENSNYVCSTCRCEKYKWANYGHLINLSEYKTDTSRWSAEDDESVAEETTENETINMENPPTKQEL